MSLKTTRLRDKLKKKAKQGFKGYPVATVTFYGPDDKRASKVAVGIIPDDTGDVAFLEKWFNENSDIRLDASINEAIADFIKQHNVKSIISPDRILGCPHEEGIDYPDGEKCPHCSFWAIRDRFTGKVIH